MLFAGSTEARQAAAALEMTKVPFKAILTETPKGPNPLTFPAERHHFADTNAMRQVLRQSGCRAVLDASHGFDRALTDFGFKAATELQLTYLRLARPLWSSQDVPGAHHVPHIRDAMPLIKAGARVFSATGAKDLSVYKRFPGDHLFLRQTHQRLQVTPFDFIEPVPGTPPFTVADEIALFQSLKIDTLMCRNLGGTASRPKVDAALQLGLQIILIDPPLPPDGMLTVFSVNEAMAWVRNL